MRLDQADHHYRLGVTQIRVATGGMSTLVNNREGVLRTLMDAK